MIDKTEFIKIATGEVEAAYNRCRKVRELREAKEVTIDAYARAGELMPYVSVQGDYSRISDELEHLFDEGIAVSEREAALDCYINMETGYVSYLPSEGCVPLFSKEKLNAAWKEVYGRGMSDGLPMYFEPFPRRGVRVEQWLSDKETILRLLGITYENLSSVVA